MVGAGSRVTAGPDVSENGATTRSVTDASGDRCALSTTDGGGGSSGRVAVGTASSSWTASSGAVTAGDSASDALGSGASVSRLSGAGS